MTAETTRDFLADLRQLDASWREARVSAAADERLRALVAAGASPTPRRGRWIVVALGAAAALIIAALAVWRLSPTAGERAPGLSAPPSSLRYGFRVIAGRVSAKDGALTCRAASCRLGVQGAGAELSLQRAARVRRVARADNSGAGPRDVQLLGGTALATVERRVAGALNFRVSAGQIEVVGTRFTMWQGQSDGQVTLHEGRVRFRATDGRTRMVAVGETLRWPLPPPNKAKVREASRSDGASASAPANDATTSRAGKQRVSPKPGERGAKARIDRRGARSLLRRIERMRSQGRYAQAAKLVASSLPRVSDEASRERLSYELGELLETVARASDRACAHWRRHRMRYPRGRYRREVDARIVACKR